MARKEKQEKPQGQPGWLITFSDMMTLMLTFFVLLVSMAVLDERRKLVVLGSIIGTFGVGRQGHDVLSQRDRRTSVEPGPMEMDSINDLEPLREMVWEDIGDDLDFASSKFVQVFSIPADVLFEPGGATLRPRGRQILEAALPVFCRYACRCCWRAHLVPARRNRRTSAVKTRSWSWTSRGGCPSRG
jgi:chemotaxis protein MotB